MWIGETEGAALRKFVVPVFRAEAVVDRFRSVISKLFMLRRERNQRTQERVMEQNLAFAWVATCGEPPNKFLKICRVDVVMNDHHFRHLRPQFCVENDLADFAAQ